MSEFVTRINEQEFEDAVIKSDIPVLVDFYADWCGPCLALGPKLDEVAKERAGKVKVVKVNVDEAPDLAARFNIRNIPFVAFIKGGQKVGHIVGNESKQAILDAVDAIL